MKMLEAIDKNETFSINLLASDYEYDSDEDVPNFVEEQVKTKLRDFNFFEYVSIDIGILTREMLTDEQIIDSVTSSTALSDNEEDGDLSETFYCRY
ncbi:hypothetical protein D910_09517 [Dendroctonus ponderosae]|uniref:Uncharacterized protein n=1 Tax=Dendroctonus ponderosae TaxID=77166 RepID=U4UGP3_DENPD|nr:hypothetical protein D910_09517 [Dendroctonus ponderosae]